MKTNPPAHWSMSEDGSFYFNEISEDGTFFTMRIDPQKGTACIEYGAWQITGVRLSGGGPVPVDGSRGLLSFLCFPLDVYELNKLLAIPLYGSVIMYGLIGLSQTVQIVSSNLHLIRMGKDGIQEFIITQADAQIERKFHSTGIGTITIPIYFIWTMKTDKRS